MFQIIWRLFQYILWICLVQMDKPTTKSPNPPFSLAGECVGEFNNRKYFAAAKHGTIRIEQGDHVLIRPAIKGEEPKVAQIQYFFEDSSKTEFFHARLLHRGTETILGDTANKSELFLSDMCRDYYPFNLLKKTKVACRRSQRSWKPPTGGAYFYSKRYERKFARFTECLGRDKACAFNFCSLCTQANELREWKTPTLIQQNCIRWKGDKYQIGSSVLLDSSVFNFNSPEPPQPQRKSDVDESLYPEYYRKEFTNKDATIPEAFCVGLITNILSSTATGSNLKILVRLFYRPENTKDGLFLKYFKDVHAVYWSRREITVKFDKVVGKCHLKYFDSSDVGEDWCNQGPCRFYFTEGYDFIACDYLEVPKQEQIACSKTVGIPPLSWPKLDVPLSCMDIFAGCGGLSEGFRQSGLCATKWAVEIDLQAAKAFQLNHPKCKVVVGDCDDLLNGKIANKRTQLPSKGEVDILIGGPPCQGFSSINRYVKSAASQTSNLLLAVSINYCEYYKPKYFVLENVRNLTTSQNCALLKSAIKRLLAMNYQVGIGVLQAGNYGLPQSRRRFFLLAAAPGHVLPKFPDPITTFDAKDYLMRFTIDDVTYINDFRWFVSAPYRSTVVKDAIGDLPLEEADEHQTIAYEPYSPDSSYQRHMRSLDDSTKVSDHYCRKTCTLDMLRISYIPKEPLADWRDLPNKCQTLPNGQMLTKIQYDYCAKNQDLSKPPRAVCHCGVNGYCQTDKYGHSLIPWALPHTADKNNHWSGVYGRLDWWGHFSTTLTKPDPKTSQGRVIHPEADRILTIRECARSQGFPDCYQFAGTIADKYKQIGNAVPPPLALAIGREIVTAHLQSMNC